MIPQTIRVALIDDDLDYASKIRAVLSPRNSARFELAHFTNLKTALEGLKSTRFNVVLLDLSLPDSTGLRTLTRIIVAPPLLLVIVLDDGCLPPATLSRIATGGMISLEKESISPQVLEDAFLRETVARTRPEGNITSGLLGSGPGKVDQPAKERRVARIASART